MAKWMIAAKKADFAAWSRMLSIDPVIARIIRNRDITTPEEAERFLHADLSSLHAPELLHGMEQAVGLIFQKIAQKRAIRIIGDYDIDGVCAAYLLKTGLERLGACVDTVIPHRQRDGYGLSDGLIDGAAADGIDTIITCDNGIAAAPQTERAARLGMTVIVTDHHEVPYAEEPDGTRRELLPEAAVVIDPKQSVCGYPFVDICGAVVAYKLVQALFQRAEQELPEEFLEFAAIATVGDVMELKDENRVLVKYGLRLLEHTQNQGLGALLEVNGLTRKKLSPYHIGFILGPCLNASGRLDTAQRALQLLEEKDERKALQLAGELKELNDSRKDMTVQGVEEACRILDGATEDKVLVVFLPDCHESLAGIIAGRLREKYGKPVFVFTRAEEGIKGSGRSIEAFHMYEHLNRCSDLFTKFGGHKMAAGLSMPEENLDPFRRRMNADCGLTAEDFEETVHLDAPMPLSYVNEALIRQFSCLEPFGTGNPQPLFAQKNVLFVSGRILGRNANVGKYMVSDETGARYEMIYFGDLEKLHACMARSGGAEAVRRLYAGTATANTGIAAGAKATADAGEARNLSNADAADKAKNAADKGKDRRDEIRLSVAYYPELNEFKGRISVQYVLKHFC